MITRVGVPAFLTTYTTTIALKTYYLPQTVFIASELR